MLRAASVTIDGEAVYCGKYGISDFEKLHSQGHDEALVRGLLRCQRETAAREEHLRVIDLRSYFIDAGIPEFEVRGGCGHADKKSEKKSDPKAHYGAPAREKVAGKGSIGNAG